MFFGNNPALTVGSAGTLAVANTRPPVPDEVAKKQGGYRPPAGHPMPMRDAAAGAAGAPRAGRHGAR